MEKNGCHLLACVYRHFTQCMWHELESRTLFTFELSLAYRISESSISESL